MGVLLFHKAFQKWGLLENTTFLVHAKNALDSLSLHSRIEPTNIWNEIVARVDETSLLALLMHNSHLISHFCTLTRTWTQGVCHMSS
jgi:hypothetical protein